MNRLRWVLIMAVAGLSTLACGAERVIAATQTFMPADTRIATATLTPTNTPAATPTLTPIPTDTPTPTQSATSIPLPSTDEIKTSFTSQIKPLINRLQAAKDNPGAELPSEYQIIYVPQTVRLYTVQAILHGISTPGSGTGARLYVLYNYSRGDTLGTRQAYSMNVSTETQEIITSLRLIMEEAGTYTLLENEKATGGVGSDSLIDLVQEAVPVLKKMSPANPTVKTDLEEMIGYACGIDMTPSLDGQRRAALLTFALGDADWAGIYQAELGLAVLKPAALESVPVLISLLNYNGDQVKSEAQIALAGMAEDPQVFDLVAKAVSNPDPEIRKQLAWVFARIESKPHAALAPLMTLFYDKDSDVPGYAASALGSMADPAAIPLMNTALKDKNPEIRQHAAGVLYEFGPQAVMAVPNLIALLQDAVANVRGEAARALSEIDTQDKASLPALIQAAKVEPDGAFGAEITAIANLSSKAETLPLLKDGLSRSDTGIRMSVCSLLQNYQGVIGASEILIQALNDQNQYIRQEAIQALAELGPEASQAVSALTKIIQAGSDTYNLGSAMYALGQIGPSAKPAIPALIPYLNSTDNELIGTSLTALRAITNQNFGPDAQKWMDWWKLNNGI